MIKGFLFIAIAFISNLAYARSTCADIRGQQSYPPLIEKNETICFVREAVLDAKTVAPIDADAISLYYIFNGGIPKKAEGQGLPYDDTPGKIVDAFSLRLNRDNRERVFVIHSLEIRESLVEPNSSGTFYSVSVFDLVEHTLHRDERASEWFGADYSWLSNGHEISYKFPYQSRNDVHQALNSPFVSLIFADDVISAKLRNKSYLFEDPNVKNKTKKYLIEGDRVTVDKATAGWCQVSYTGGAKPLQMWLMCNALDTVDSQKNRD